ncbi:MAG: ribonuclease J [Christensenellales bacterium]
MPQKQKKVRIIPLGGVGEIGKNMTVVEYGNDMIVVDCGSIFPEEEMLGVDLVIPDISYITQNKEKLRGFFITHGHEDHIGAMPYVLKSVNAPVYGTRLTLGLLENKFKEHRVRGVKMNRVQAGDTVQAGCFKIEFIKVNHSIAGACALAVHTPVGVVLFSGDFKVDFTPIDHEIMDLNKLAQLGNEGVLMMLCESTNVERPGYTMSERTVGETFEVFFKKATEQGARIIIATFSSNIYRIQQIIDAAVRYGRKVCFAGRSMVNVGNMAVGLGDLHVPEGVLVDLDHVDQYPGEKMTIITTGSQGEPMSGLVRMSTSEHRQIEIREGDMVIISANPIPGNEKYVSRVINQLYRRGAQVIYESLADVHVSGHACQEEIKLVHALVKPKFFIPVHGEYRHLYQHAQLARSMGMPEENIIIANVGNVIELSPNNAEVVDTVQAGPILVDGFGVGDVGNVVLRDRKLLSQDGLLVVVVSLSAETGEIMAGPDIISRGFVYVRESDVLMDQCKAVVRETCEGFARQSAFDWNGVKNDIRNNLRDYIYGKTKRAPMILPVVVEI